MRKFEVLLQKNIIPGVLIPNNKIFFLTGREIRLNSEAFFFSRKFQVFSYGYRRGKWLVTRVEREAGVRFVVAHRTQ